jgi:hypothetical protein
MVKAIRRNRNKEDWLFGKACDKSLAISSRLPLKLQVVRRFQYFRRLDDNKQAKQIFRMILDELKEIWRKTEIPIKADRNCFRELFKIHKALFAMKKIEVDSILDG